MKKIITLGLLAGLALIPPALRADEPVAAPAAAPTLAGQPDLKEVLVYPTEEEGSMMHWLVVSKLRYNASYIGDSISYDVFKGDGGNELTVRPSAGDRVQNQTWRKVHFSGSVNGPTMMELNRISGGVGYIITICANYIYSPVDRPNAIFSGSSDDGLKVILNNKKIWTNQIQRSPTYDSDQFPAPLKKGWNSLICVVDDVMGGHLLTGRFLDGGQPIKDIEIALDPPAADAVRHPAAPYNEQAAAAMRAGDDLRAGGKPAEAIAAYEQVLLKYPLADVAPRAMFAKANALYSADGEKSLDQPAEAVAALDQLLGKYGQDLLAEYALMDRARVEEVALKDPARAEATYRSFETRFPQSSLAAKSQIEVARLLANQKKYEDAILTYRRIIKQYPQSDEVMTANVGIGDVYVLSGDKPKAQAQYEVARAMAKDWHDNKYGIDVGKQAWLTGILDYLQKQMA